MPRSDRHLMPCLNLILCNFALSVQDFRLLLQCSWGLHYALAVTHGSFNRFWDRSHVSSLVPQCYCICLSSRNFWNYHINNDSNNFSSLSWFQVTDNTKHLLSSLESCLSIIILVSYVLHFFLACFHGWFFQNVLNFICIFLYKLCYAWNL